MVPELRSAYNAAFTLERYAAFLKWLEIEGGCPIDFRVSETPVFLSDRVTLDLERGALEILHQLETPEYRSYSTRAIPAGRAVPGDTLIAAKVALAWHLRQRDSARTLRLVREVMPVVGAAAAFAQGDGIAACQSRAALAAAEAATFYCGFDEAERYLAAEIFQAAWSRMPWTWRAREPTRKS